MTLYLDTSLILAALSTKLQPHAADVAAESTASIPVGRYGDPAEYAATVAFLASRRASCITGSIIRVDGGFISSI